MAELRADRKVSLSSSSRVPVSVRRRPLDDGTGRVALDQLEDGRRVVYTLLSAEEDAALYPAAPAPDPNPTPDPTPTPAPVPTPVSTRWYSTDSPFNTPIAADVQTHPSSAQWIAMILKNGGPSDMLAGVAGSTAYDWGKPFYTAKDTDPKYKLHATQPWGTCSIEGMTIPVPVGALPAGGADAHMTIFAPDGWEYDLWEAQRPANGVLNFGWSHGRVRVDGPGFPGGAVAMRTASGAGPIRAEELISGRIDHALFTAVNCASSSFVYPASASDGHTAGGIPQGSRLQLAMTDSQIAALNLPAWQKTILTALAHYGTYVGDSTGNTRMTIQFESEQAYVSQGKPAPIAEYAKQVGIPLVNGAYAFKVSQGVDWAKYLRVVQPPPSH